MARRRLRTGSSSGFTLLELIIVMIIMAILLSIAVPIYNQSIVRSREAVLRNDLFEMRKLISQYTLDKQKAPQSLDDLVQAGYIKTIPKDPMTGEANWEPQQEDVLLTVDQQDPGIDDVHSASPAVSSDGTSAYNTW
jgi:general secretion pathway protein G